MKKALLPLIFHFSFISLQAQDSRNMVTGSWYGKADVDMAGNYSNYLTELIIKQKGDEVEGIFGYYFKDVYQSFYVHGSYDAKSREITIKNIPVIYFGTNSTVNSIECNTDFVGKLFVSALKKGINGYFYHDGKYKYTCPDLRVTYTLDLDEKEDSILQNSVTGKKIWQPQPEDFVITATHTQKEEIKPFASGNLPNSIADKTPRLQTIEVTPSKDAQDAKKISDAYTKRHNNYQKDLVVESDSIKVSFYDNGDIDGDSISVFLNNQLVLSHQGLTAKAINLFVELDSSRSINEISMFAENLGSIPPNTALMVVSDGINRYEVYMSSSLTQSSSVRLIRKKRT
jgi:hypothetical protein